MLRLATGGQSFFRTGAADASFAETLCGQGFRHIVLDKAKRKEGQRYTAKNGFILCKADAVLPGSIRQGRPPFEKKDIVLLY